MIDTVVANEILEILESSIISSESKNSILVDYIKQIREDAYNNGQKAIVVEILMTANDVPMEVTFKKMLKALR